MTTFYTAKAAAHLLGLTPATVQRQCQRGEVPARKHGRAYLITADTLPLIRVRAPGRPRRREADAPAVTTVGTATT
jgi:excisionase family DNA binding protein